MARPEPEELTMFEHAMERAYVARAAIACLSVYLIIAGHSWTGQDETLFGVGGLDAQFTFTAAGLLGFPMVLWPRTRWGLVPWLAVLGTACVGRTMSVLFIDTYGYDQRLRSVGWIVTWMLALVAVLQIQASEILRQREAQWTG